MTDGEHIRDVIERRHEKVCEDIGVELRAMARAAVREPVEPLSRTYSLVDTSEPDGPDVRIWVRLDAHIIPEPES